MKKDNFKIFHFIRNWLLDIRHLFKLCLVILIFSFLFHPFVPVQAITNHNYPRIANYFLKWTISDSEASQLARWDLLILDMETQVTSPAQLKKIKQLNPDIVLLAYITPQEILNNAGSSYSSLRRKLAGQIPDSWYLKNSAGNKISVWGGTSMLNVTESCPEVNGQKLNVFLARFVNEQILNTGLWEGIFYDNAWENLTDIAGSDVDADNNGVKDNNLNSTWQTGLKRLYNETKNLSSNKDYLIIGNATTAVYREALNGNMSETFPHGDWVGRMQTYAANEVSNLKPRINIINANTANTAKVSYQDLRFALASTLMGNGYFSFDYGNQDHGQTWLYDEYGVNLGEPIENAKSQNKYIIFKKDVWQRNFSNGLVLVNSSDENKTVSLGGEYEKIHGVQDPAVNNGEIVMQTNLASGDGLLLLKTFSTLNDVLFRNGDFLRFFSAKGDRLRNGFFVFESLYKGGDKVAHVDLDSNGVRDLLVVSGNKLMAWRDDGQLYMKIYPYTVDYKGELRVALGDLNKDGFVEVYVAPSTGYPLPIKIYTRHGRQMKQDWFPYGEKYFGGYSLAVGDLNNGVNSGKDLLVGKASGEPAVSVFDYKYNLTNTWLAFNNRFGVNLASGNVDGVAGDEVIAGAGAGSSPYIRVFNKEGKLLNEFLAYSSLSNPGIEVLTADVNFDGIVDIIGMGSGF
ncbi:MAG: hypothetical protein US42_C0013G0012 [Candidatus Magasanikbacteria bacterium GW2011_GWC2_37_14]|uniref:FG-GAP repeat protein n=1 Tax=Candidatus Magasanikbacteria bacterium GW2011_GWC2_37_14 TaxID=1619046 RepID=A0A0G0G7X6_9BACT|nr:MAG: hypothetical protein US42_C0013G0012 [Candidatus Magasanikbacteria bacterium GW2011_GWC2_37_14]